MSFEKLVTNLNGLGSSKCLVLCRVSLECFLNAASQPGSSHWREGGGRRKEGDRGRIECEGKKEEGGRKREEG